MLSLQLHVSTLIEWDVENGPARVERILLIEPNENNLALSDVVTINADVKDTHALPVFYKYEQLATAVTANRARVFQKGELYAPPYLPEDPKDLKYMERRAEYLKRRDVAWELIEPLIETYGWRLLNKWERGKIICEHAQKTGRRAATICVLLRRYCQRGMTKDALLPDWQNCGHVLLRVDHGAKRGRPPNEGNPIGRNVTEEDRKIFRDGIDEFIVRGGKKPTDAWQLIKEKYYKTGTHRLKDGTDSPTLQSADTIPTPRQFEYYYYKNRNRRAEIIGSQGETAFNRDNRPLDGNPDILATRPGAVYQIDATIGDIYLVSHLDRTIIGRPVIYIVIDMFSRLITGLAVTLEGPNWAGARLALACAFLNKIEFCRRYGVEIEEGQWPVEGKCESLLADNGEIKGYNANSLVDPLGIRVSNAEAYRPDWKAIVERKFRTINHEFIDWQPGRIPPVRRVRGPDYRLEARLDLNTFRRMMIRCVLFWNNSRRLKKYRMTKEMMRERVEPIPVRLWNHGMYKMTGGLRSETEEIIRRNLLPRREVSVTTDGIQVEGLNYTCERAVREQWFIRYEGRRDFHVEVMQESLVNRVLLRLNGGHNFEECVLKDKDKRYEGMDWYEIRHQLALSNQVSRAYETTFQQSLADLHAQLANDAASSIKATEEAWSKDGLSNTARLRGIRSKRGTLKSHERKYESGNTNNLSIQVDSPEPVTAVVDVPALPPAPPAPAGYIPPAEPFDEIRAARERKIKNGKQ